MPEVQRFTINEEALTELPENGKPDGIETQIIDEGKETLVDAEMTEMEAAVAFLQGHDTFVALPTGYGKSIIFAMLPGTFDKYKGEQTVSLFP